MCVCIYICIVTGDLDIFQRKSFETVVMFEKVLENTKISRRTRHTQCAAFVARMVFGSRKNNPAWRRCRRDAVAVGRVEESMLHLSETRIVSCEQYTQRRDG